jgi:hypothetical protein
MDSFGQLLRHYRRQSTDPVRGGLLTQSRLGELLGEELGHMGYSGAAISDWERDKSKIHADDRHLLVALARVLVHCGAVQTAVEVNHWLETGNYRALDAVESADLFALDSSSPPPTTLAAETTAPPPAAKWRKQDVLLDKVTHFWVQGVLQQAVQGAMLLDLAWEWQSTAVMQPWQSVLGTAVEPPPLVTLYQAFQESECALLILGEPGSGKTISLILLARDLIEQARQDGQQPAPVILNLASWMAEKRPLAEWVVEELNAKYQIPRALGREWLADDGLVLLLDGLDEMPEAHQLACHQAINQFRATNGLTGLVVCARTADYARTTETAHTPTLLNLGGAIALQPLTVTQIQEYLTAAGISWSAVQTAVLQDPALQEMAKSPLLLSVLRQAYANHHTPQTAVAETSDPTADRYQTLFDTYLRQMVQRHGPTLYPVEQSRHWLAWLARRLTQHNEVMLLIEHIQPSWLPTVWQRRRFLLASRLIDGIALGTVAWLFWLLVRRALVYLPIIWDENLAQVFRVEDHIGSTYLLLFLLIYLLLGLLVGGVDVALYERQERREAAGLRRSLGRWEHTAVVVGVVGLASLVTAVFFSTFTVGLAAGVFAVFAFGLTTYYIHGASYRSDIRTVEALNWSWPGSFAGLMMGLFAATLFEVIEYQVVGATPVLRTYISLGLLFLLLGGLRGNRLPTTTRPNQGIWLSATSALAAAGLFAIPLSLVTAVLWDPQFGAIVGFLCGWVAAGLYGMGSVLNHFLLRAQLTRLGCIPWRLLPFLDDAAAHVILYKVGGGYIFIHRLLQEYFATLNGDT